MEQEDLQGELTCEVCELTFEGVLEMETHSATHFVDNQNVSFITFLDWCVHFLFIGPISMI